MHGPNDKRTNKTSSTLGMGGTILSPEEWKGQIFGAVKENETLEELYLNYSLGTEEIVFMDLMSLLQLSAIRLRKNDFYRSEMGSRPGQVDEEIRMNLRYGGQFSPVCREWLSRGPVDFRTLASICQFWKVSVN